NRVGGARVHWVAGAPFRLALLLRLVGLSADGELRLQLEKVLLADAAYVHQLLDFLERTVLGSVLDDQRRRFRTDAGQRVELRGGCGVDVDRRGRRLGLDRCARGRLGLRRGGWRLNRDERRE